MKLAQSLLALCFIVVPAMAASPSDEAAARDSDKALGDGKALLTAIREKKYEDVIKKTEFPVTVNVTHWSKKCDRSGGEEKIAGNAAELQPYLESLTKSLEQHSKEEIRTHGTDSGHDGGITYEVGFYTSDACRKMFAVDVVLKSGKLAGLHTESAQSLEDWERAPNWVAPLFKGLIQNPMNKALKKYFRFPVEIRTSHYEPGQAGDCSVGIKKTKTMAVKTIRKPLEAVRKAAGRIGGEPSEMNQKGWWGVFESGDCEHVWAVRFDKKSHKVTGLWGDFE